MTRSWLSSDLFGLLRYSNAFRLNLCARNHGFPTCLLKLDKSFKFGLGITNCQRSVLAEFVVDNFAARSGDGLFFQFFDIGLDRKSTRLNSSH